MYNGENYIKDCYKCLEEQTYKNLEIIFINDGSKDNTKNLLDDLAEKDNRVVVVHKENSGVSSARNAGLDIAKGEYISFYDVDDQLDSCFFEVLLNDIFEYNVDIAVCQYAWYASNSAVENIDSTVGVFDNIYSSFDNIFLSFIGNEKSQIFDVVWGRIFKSSVLNNIRFNINLSFSEDSLFMMMVFAKTSNVFFDSYVGYKYIHREDSAVQAIKKDFKGRCKNGADMSICFIEIHKICCSCCSTEIIKLSKDKIKQEIHMILYRIIKNKEKWYYKKNKKFFKQIIKEIDFTDVSFKHKVYLKLYLFSNQLCWFVSRGVAILQKIKSK